jgi:hypothetical protein
MPILEIVCDSGKAVSFGIEGWLQSSEEMVAWQHLVTHIVQYAYMGRAATAITMSPMPWSIGHSLPEPSILWVNKNKYIVNRMAHCSVELMAEVAESEDFQRSILWLAALGAHDKLGLMALIRQIDVTSAEPPSTNYELLLLMDDARQLNWLHTGRDAEAVQDDVISMAQTLGWQVKTTARKADESR